MFTKLSLAALQNERNNMLNSHKVVVTADMEKHKAIYVQHLRQMATLGNRTYSLFDFQHAKFDLHFSAYTRRLHQVSICTEHSDNWKHTNQLFHPDDLRFNLETDLLFYHLLMSLSPEEQKLFQLLCLRRIKNKFNQYDMYLVSAQVTHYDENDSPWLLTIETELLTQHKQQTFNHIRQYILLNEENRSINKRFERECTCALTPQEYEVLLLACKGKGIREMAEQLHVEITTIKSHRSQVMEKLNSGKLDLACVIACKLRIQEELNQLPNNSWLVNSHKNPQPPKGG